MNSIQARLTLRLVLCDLAVSVAGSLAVFLVFRSAMLSQFNQALRSEAQSIAALFVRDHDGSYEFNGPQDASKTFRHGHHADFFCIRRQDGKVFVKSPSLGKSPCPGIERPTDYESYDQVEVEGHLHHGKHLRAIFLTFTPIAERGVSHDRFQIVLAAEHDEIDELLERLLRALGFVAVVAGTLTALLVVWTVQRDLAPLRSLALEAGQIGAGNLDKRFALAKVPHELAPFYRAMNGLLERIEDAWKRERRFTADVAHELRTPVAELRSLCDVAIAAADDPKAPAEALADARAIAVQMENLISALLELRRAQTGKPPTLIDAATIAKQAWQTAEPLAVERGLSFTWQGPSALEMLCDPTMLAAVLRNLFDNAANYTAQGGAIACVVSPAAITVRNRPHGLVPEDIAHLAEPFWRKDPARSGGSHAGLGLALADAYCRAFGGELAVCLDEGWLVVTVRFSTAQKSGEC